jgi:hypothetical protein
MAVERQAARTRSGRDPVGSDPSPVGRVALVGGLSLGMALVGWFLAAWLVAGKGLIDSLAEVIGVGSAFLLLVAVIGTVRDNWRRDRDLE